MKKNNYKTIRRTAGRGRQIERRGLAALEVVLSTAITFTVLGFSTYWLIRICRVIFSVIGEMVGSPLM